MSANRTGGALRPRIAHRAVVVEMIASQVREHGEPSEHEGFGVPLLEAMAFDKPILARECAAIPETLGGAGFLVPGADGPQLYAEAIMELVANERLRDDLIRRGRERLADFDTSTTKRELLAALLEVA